MKLTFEGWNIEMINKERYTIQCQVMVNVVNKTKVGPEDRE